MGELQISTTKDLAKLQGWTIKEAEAIRGTNGFQIRLSHLIAAKEVLVTIGPALKIALQGNQVRVSVGLNLQIKDVEEQ